MVVLMRFGGAPTEGWTRGGGGLGCGSSLRVCPSLHGTGRL